MVSSEVQRTLVKSPPELWAEISDPESLARHLNEFGEIRITRVHPEQKVEWEADDASGAVVIKPSGWGTKVKLTVTRELVLDAEREPAPDDDALPELDANANAEPGADARPPAEAQAEPEVEVEAAFDDRFERMPAVEPDAEPRPATENGSSFDAEPQPEPTAEPEPRRGFFARLFGRRHAAPPAIAESSCDEQPAGIAPAEPDPEAEPELDAEPELATDRELAVQAEPELRAQSVSEPRHEDRATPGAAEQSERAAEQQSDIAAELAAAEEAAEEQVAAVLTGVLDRLGAAHHRPFSRP
ncbi:MAG TPA: hypothetical protein VGX69_06365 [Solirubrobacteraceae bacterium]|jgi:hypothetical protein|nr:hypothetical protein [Solirubrobacteraceae bacterium]